MQNRSARETWEAALQELKIQVSKANYRTWLEKTVGLSYQGEQFVVGVPNTFAAEYLDMNQRSLIEKTLIGLTNHETKVIFQVVNNHDSLTGDNNVPDGKASAPTHGNAFNQKYTFGSFIVGSSNQLAYAAALQVAENPGHGYNPLFIYGGVGLGKTHLLYAIGHTALITHLRTLFVSAERFTNEFVKAIRAKKTEEFRDKYRSVDVLLIDDIQFISGKEQTEECFFHTFNELHNSNRQIAVTCDCPPKSMTLLQDRLRSRFEWGLVADIQPPDLETRVAILQAKTEAEGVDIPSDVLMFIAQRVQHNIRELEGALNRVIAYAQLVRAKPNLDLASRALVDIASREHNKKNPITADMVIEAVASGFQLTSQDLKSRKREREIALARQVAMYFLKEANNCSLTQIGKDLGDRDHHLVSHAHKKIASDLATNPDLHSKVSEIRQRLYQ